MTIKGYEFTYGYTAGNENLPIPAALRVTAGSVENCVIEACKTFNFCSVFVDGANGQVADCVIRKNGTE